jgi:aminoglycoside phosphotransferase (APT) family kinase protein
VSSTPHLNLEALGLYFDAFGIQRLGALQGELISGGRSNLTYRVTDGLMSWVVRRPPAAGQTTSAHDVVREARVGRALAGTVVPVPPVVALCEDTAVLGVPFTVTAWVQGRIVRDRDELDALSDGQVAAVCSSMMEVLAGLHDVDPAAVGLEGFGRPEGFVARQVALWRRQWDRVRTRDLPDVERLHALLSERVPASQASGIVHGDYRIDNLMLDDGNPATITAVLDWELSTLGDPRTDVALMCTYRHPALDVVLGLPAAWASPRLPSADDLAQAYAQRSGRDLGDWPFYLSLAAFKLAVISEGIAHRAHAGADASRNAAQAAEAVPDLISAGLAHLRA